MLTQSDKWSSKNNFSSNESEGTKEQELKTQEDPETEQSDFESNI